MARLPSLFVSHGAPTFALDPGRAGPALTALGQALPRPEAVLVVSPHWMTPGLRVGLAAQPQTVHDFGGFDPALYRIEYPAPGHPALARKTLETLAAFGPALPDDHRGLDHGAWVPLLHLYPQADVPVYQVSLPVRLDGERAWAFGQALAPLADEGVLILGSGSLTHNLGDFRGGHGADLAYVNVFADWVREAVVAGDGARLRRTLDDAPHAARAHPTPEHFWPLLVAAGAAQPGQPWRVIDGGIAHGMLAMDAIVFGHA
ncbi:dioxygenase [Ramlibacter sp.]|uniref:dioxygenase family protein n=1 Tax=Ramlibacter sp. TaxID=1917967 RepID=UPI0035ADFEBE